MAQSKIDNLQTYSDGRYDYQLPVGGRINDYSVDMDGIDLKLDGFTDGNGVHAQMQAMRKRVMELPDSPIITCSQWSVDSMGILYVMDMSDPDYYQLEGRRILPNGVFIAITSGEKDKSQLMKQIIQEALSDFHPSESAFGKRGVFAMHGGYTTQPYHGQEDLFSSWINPDYGLSFDISSQVFLQPQKLDLIERSLRAAAAIHETGGMDKELRKGSRMLNGMMGEEYVDVYEDDYGKLNYIARLQVPGEAISPLKPQLEITLQTGALVPSFPPPTHKLTQEQFLALWDALVTSFKARDLN